MAAQAKPMQARTGRTNQRYAEDGSRLVAGIVALSSDKRKVLVIESTHRKNHWVLPKGGWESDESAQDAAAREAWEEAGITGTITRDLGEIYDFRSKKGAATYLFFEMEVVEEGAKWPEMEKRKRLWVAYEEAMTKFSGRQELKDALERSSIIKS